MRKTPVLSLLVVVWISIVWVGTQSSTSSPAAQVPMAEKTAGVGAAGTLAAPLLTGTIQILAYVQYADMSAGGEVAHTFSAISSVGTNYVRTDLTDYTQLASAIAGKNVLLIPEQERTSAAQLQTVGSAWASFLPSFVANGGVVIQCDHSGKYQILPSAGLMNITGSSNFYGGYPVTIADPSDPVALGVSPYTAENGSSTYVCSEGNVVVQRSSGNPVVINKRIGRGHVVAIGHDYYSSNANQDRVVGNAVFNLPQVLDPLWIQPWGDFISQGLEGGPFTPAETSYMAVNMSTRATLRWTASASQPWLDVAPGSGTLGPASLATVRVSINANANRLPMGVTTDTVTFTNLDSGLRQQRQVTLRVISHGSVASMPFLETFELGPPLAPYWEVTGTNEYRTQVTSLNGPHGGAYHLTMDDAVDGASYSRNELTLTINLARWQDVVLRFWAREWNDESHGPPSSPFVGGADFDGVAISDDGVNWYEVHGLRDLTSEYQQRTVDLDAAIAARGLSYNSAFRIRFNHYDDYGITTDGFAFDDIEITGNPADDLSLTPGIFVSSGSEGGPFTPAETTYMAVNMSTRATLRWTASQSQPWLNVAPGSGTLGPGSSASVRVSINANANSLPFGEHYGDISFTNVTSGFTQKRYAHLTIVPPNLVLSLADFAPTAPVQLRPGDLVTLSALIENHSLGGARSFWTEVWGSQTGGLTLDRFLADSFLLRGGLPPNGMHSWVGAARLYSIPDGSYTVVYHADRPNQVAESNERDNRAVVRGKRILVIRPQTQVDLAVERFAMSPNPAFSGQAVAFTGQVVNRGSEASGPFWIEFWGSWEWPFPSRNFFLCDSILISNLDAGKAINLADYSRKLYEVPTGVFLVGCIADRNDSVNELDEANNHQFVAGQVFNNALVPAREQPYAQSAADIAILAIDCSPTAPVQLAPGDKIAFTVDLTNRGAADTGPFWLEYWGSRDGGVTLTSFLADSDRIANLAPGQTARLASRKTLVGAPDGPYSVVVFADRPAAVADSDRLNNRFTFAGKRVLVIRPQTGANLVIAGFGFNVTQWPQISVSGTVRNAGTANSGPFWIEFWAAAGDPDYPGLGRLVCDSIHVNNLAPSQSLSLSQYSKQIYSQIPEGTYCIVGFADRLDQVIETDETDNYAFRRSFIVPPH